MVGGEEREERREIELEIERCIEIEGEKERGRRSREIDIQIILNHLSLTHQVTLIYLKSDYKVAYSMTLRAA